jgi:hypothetical protein
MIFLRGFQPFPDDVKLSRWCLDSLLGLLLKSVKRVDRPDQLHRVDRTIRISVIVRHDFQHAGTAESLEDLGIHVLSTYPSLVESKADRLANLSGKRLQILMGRTHPEDWLWALRLACAHAMPIMA